MKVKLIKDWKLPGVGTIKKSGTVVNVHPSIIPQMIEDEVIKGKKKEVKKP